MLTPEQIIQITDNNPDRLFYTFCIIAVVYIVFSILSIRCTNKRLKRLKVVRKKIEKRHQSIEYENSMRRRNIEKDKARMGIK